MAKLNFDATGVPPDLGKGDPLPPGWYNVAMASSENKPTKGGVDSSYLECIFGVLDGQFQGRKLYYRFNLKNANAQAVEIAYKQLSAVMHAVNHLQCGDSTELHGRPLKVRVKVKPAEGEYEASNEITAFKNINDQSAATPTAPGFGAPPTFMPPPQAGPPAGWAPQPPAGPPQGWAPPAVGFAAPAPAGPPPGWQPPAPAAVAWQAPPAPPAAAPAWQPPAGAPPQPWAAPPAAPAAPAAPQAPVPVAGPPAWSPPPAVGVQPPWMTQPPAA